MRNGACAAVVGVVLAIFTCCIARAQDVGMRWNWSYAHLLSDKTFAAHPTRIIYRAGTAAVTINGTAIKIVFNQMQLPNWIMTFEGTLTKDGQIKGGFKGGLDMEDKAHASFVGRYRERDVPVVRGMCVQREILLRHSADPKTPDEIPSGAVLILVPQQTGICEGLI